MEMAHKLPDSATNNDAFLIGGPCFENISIRDDYKQSPELLFVAPR